MSLVVENFMSGALMLSEKCHDKNVGPRESKAEIAVTNHLVPIIIYVQFHFSMLLCGFYNLFLIFSILFFPL